MAYPVRFDCYPPPRTRPGPLPHLTPTPCPMPPTPKPENPTRLRSQGFLFGSAGVYDEAGSPMKLPYTQSMDWNHAESERVRTRGGWGGAGWG